MYINYKIKIDKDMVIVISIKEGENLFKALQNDERLKGLYNSDFGCWFLDITRL